MVYTEWSIQHVGRFISLESQNLGLRVYEMLMAKFMQQNVQRKKKILLKNDCSYGQASFIVCLKTVTLLLITRFQPR